MGNRHDQNTLYACMKYTLKLYFIKSILVKYIEKEFIFLVSILTKDTSVE